MTTAALAGPSTRDIRVAYTVEFITCLGTNLLLLGVYFYTHARLGWTLKQNFLLAAGQGGTHPKGRETWGQSAIVDPWGRILAEQAKGEAVLLAERDSEEQAAVRQRMPIARHRRFFPPVEPRPARTE